MRILVIHQNFPGQFGHLVKTWAQRPGWDVRALGRDSAPGLPGFEKLLRYKLTRAVHVEQHSYLRVLQVSAAHVYLSYPFVLSRSLLEAMACGAPIVGSNTAPVLEVMRDGKNTRLVDFFDVQAIANTTFELLNAHDQHLPMCKQARVDTQRYSKNEGVAGYENTLGVTHDKWSFCVDTYASATDGRRWWIWTGNES